MQRGRCGIDWVLRDKPFFTFLLFMPLATIERSEASAERRGVRRGVGRVERVEGGWSFRGLRRSATEQERAWSSSLESHFPFATLARSRLFLITRRYDHSGRHVQKIAPGATHTYFYGGWQLLKETRHLAASRSGSDAARRRISLGVTRMEAASP